MKKKLSWVGAGDREASQTRDGCGANKEGRLALNATHKTRRSAGAPSGPSRDKKRLAQDDISVRVGTQGPSTRAKGALAQDDKAGGRLIKGCKERGEWAELCFMARAAGLGMGVSKPLGDSRRYDVLVEAGGRIARVQVKSTLYRRRRNEYSLNVMGPGRKSYKEGTVDFFAVYLIPEDEWYIIP